MATSRLGAEDVGWLEVLPWKDVGAEIVTAELATPRAIIEAGDHSAQCTSRLHMYNMCIDVLRG